MHNLLTQFELLLKALKWKEAKEMLEKLANDKLTPKEEAEAKVLQARLAIKLENAINEAYIATLDSSIERLKNLQAKGRSFFEKVKLAKTRAELAK